MTDLGLDPKQIRFQDIECTCCGTHFIELTDGDVCLVMLDHKCAQSDFLHYQAANAYSLAETCRVLASQWKHHSAADWEDAR